MAAEEVGSTESGAFAITMKPQVIKCRASVSGQPAKDSPGGLSKSPQPWKSQAKQLQKEGRFGTIMKAYVNKTVQPLPTRVKQQIRVPKASDRALSRPRFVRKSKIAMEEKRLPSSPLGNGSELGEIDSVGSSRETIMSRSLEEHLYATKQVLFSDFPMAKKGFTSDGLDYFLGVCAGPALGKPPGWNWRSGPQSEYSTWYIQNILRSDILFELIVAYAVGLRVYLQKDLEGVWPTQAVAFHIQNALPRLRKSLEKGDAWLDDGIVWSVIMMCATTYIPQDFNAFKVHARGLRQLINLRGGMNALDKFGFFKRRVINIEASLHATLEHERTGMMANTRLIYHQHPLPPHLVQKLSTFPDGFAELPFEISLSENMIDFIEHNLQALRNPPQGPSQINDIYITDWILSFPLSRLERLIAVALITNSLLLDRLHRAQISPVNSYRAQREFPLLIDSRYSIQSDYVVWALLTLRNTVRFNPKLANWIDDHLEVVALDGDRMFQLQARYCPIPQLLVDEERLPDEI